MARTALAGDPVSDLAAARGARDPALELLPERREPQVLIEPLTATAPPAELMSERLLSFEYEDEDKEPPVVRMTFRNDDDAMLAPEALALGAAYRVSFGYPDTSVTRGVVLKKVSGAGRNARGDTIVYEGRPLDIDMQHVDAGRAAAGLPLLLNMRVSDAAREVARLLDFRGASALIEQTEPVYAEIVFRESETPLQFVARMARRHNFTWGVKNSVFHFHSRGFRPLNTVEVQRASPQVLSLDFEGDFTVPSPSVVRAAGYDPGAREILVNETRPDEGGDAPAGRLLVTDSLSEDRRLYLVGRERIPTSDARHKLRLASERLFLARAARQWTLNLRLLGDPSILSGTVLNLTLYPPVLNGEWHVRGVRHLIDSKGGYVTEISEATRRAPKISGAPRVVGEIPIDEVTSEGSRAAGRVLVTDRLPRPRARPNRPRRP